jgi:hypothetical protein
MSLPPNKYDDFSSSRKIHSNVIDTTPYRNVLLDILKGILQAYSIMLEPSYSSLPPNDEDFISAKLYDDFLDNDNFTRQFNLNDYTFELETASTKDYIQIGYNDIKVRVNNRLEGFESRKSAYIIECKRLDGKQAKEHHTKTLNRKYLEDGIQRFVDEIYIEKYIHKQSAMIGYVVSPFDIHQNITHVNELVNSMPSLNTTQNLTAFKLDESFEYAYHSKHKSIHNNDIDIYHLMLDFSSKIIT